MKICFGPSIELSHRVSTFEYPQNSLGQEIRKSDKKNIDKKIDEKKSFFKKK